jgi:hypothetical protein
MQTVMQMQTPTPTLSHTQTHTPPTQETLESPAGTSSGVAHMTIATALPWRPFLAWATVLYVCVINEFDCIAHQHARPHVL